MVSEAKGVMYVPVWVDDGVIKALVLDSGYLPVIEQTPITSIESQMHGYLDGAWQKQNMLWGYASKYAERETAINVAAGDVYMHFTVVPAGEIWVINTLSTHSDQSNCTHVYIGVAGEGIWYWVNSKAAPQAYDAVNTPNPFILGEGDQIRVLYKGAALNDDFYAYARGYKMNLDM